MEFGAALDAAWEAMDALPAGPEVDAMRLALLDVEGWWHCCDAVQRGAGGRDPALTRGLGWSEV